MSEKKGFQKTLEIAKKIQNIIDEHESKSTRGPHPVNNKLFLDETDFMIKKEPVIDRIEIMTKDGETKTLAVRNRRKMK